MSPSIYAARPWNQLYMSTVAPWLAPQSFRGLRKRLHVLEQRETMSMVENSRLQWQAVGRLLQHAYDTTPFYRERFDSGRITPAQITSPAGLDSAFPTLTRNDIRTRLDDLWSRRYRRERSAGRGDWRDHGFAHAAFALARNDSRKIGDAEPV